MNVFLYKKNKYRIWKSLSNFRLSLQDAGLIYNGREYKNKLNEYKSKFVFKPNF